MVTCVLGAPGSGKTTVAPLLRSILPTHVVLDWDAFMDPASELADRDVRRSPETWPIYGRLVRAIVDSIQPTPAILLGVCTPDELPDWPIDSWILLDCSDRERGKRLGVNRDRAEIAEAVADGQRYRALGLPTLDTTDRSADAVARAVADVIAARR